MTEKLDKQTCKPCVEGAEPLAADIIEKLKKQLPGGWKIEDGHHLAKTFAFDNFQQALDFTNRVGEIAEAENHHPEILLTWGKVEVRIWSHKADGLTENDFILAAKADAKY